jgi:hypothetical protein
MDLEATWEERCQSLREETGLNVLSLLELEGMKLHAPLLLPPSPSKWRGNHVLGDVVVAPFPLMFDIRASIAQYHF